jgi:hypothetical protein
MRGCGFVLGRGQLRGEVEERRDAGLEEKRGGERKRVQVGQGMG